jgi:hypothetical protein
MSNENLDAWLHMQEAQGTHGRHHEELRSQSTNLIVAVSAAILAFLSSTAASAKNIWTLALFLIVVNVYGFFMSLKHYERSRLHYDVARSYADIISEHCKLGDTTLNGVRSAAHSRHSKRFSFVRKFRTNVLWSCLHLLLAALGVFLFWVN